MDIQSVLLSAAPYLVPFMVAFAVGLGKLFLQHLPANQREEAARIVQVAVTAAEQGMPGATGEEKKAEVVSRLEDVLRHSHLNVPPTLVDMFIESAVAAMNEGKPPLATTSSVGFVPPSATTGPTLRR